MQQVSNIIEDKFKEIYDKNFDMIFRIAVIYLKNIQEAEDVIQEVFLKLLQSKTIFADDEHMKAWLITVTKNLCKDKLKSFWKVRRIDIEGLGELVYEEEDSTQVLEELLSIPEKYNIILYLFYYEGYKVKEISRLLNIKESTIQTRLARGRKLLEKKVKESLE